MGFPYGSPRSPSTSGPRALVWLILALIPAFAATAAVTRAYRAEQRRLAAEWFNRGQAALDAQRPGDAITAFRTALTFSREDRTFRFRLAQALAAAGRPAEARAYFLMLRDAQPGSGPVNLELGRLAARQGLTAEAIRYYHAAIEGAWNTAAEERRREARLELIEFLVAHGARIPAQAELIALHGDLPPDRESRLRIARLTAAAGLREAALALAREVAKAAPRDPEVLRQTGLLAFEAEAFAVAVPYLSRAVAGGVSDPAVGESLEVSRLVLALDPFQRRLSTRERMLRARRGFDAAFRRFRGCPDTVREQHAELAGEAQSLGTALTPGTRPDADAVESLADLTVRLTLAARECGELSRVDRALVLLAERQRREA